MSGGAAVIIGDDENKTPTSMTVGIAYPVSAIHAIKNPATSGPDAYVVFVNNSMVTTDIFLDPQEEHAITEAGSVTLQP